MRLSGVVYKTVIAVSVAIALLTVAPLMVLEPGSGTWEVSVFTLGVSAVAFAIAAAGLYFRFDPFRPFEEL